MSEEEARFYAVREQKQRERALVAEAQVRALTSSGKTFRERAERAEALAADYRQQIQDHEDQNDDIAALEAQVADLTAHVAAHAAKGCEWCAEALRQVGR